jgi:hypothetical protein
VTFLIIYYIEKKKEKRKKKKNEWLPVEKPPFRGDQATRNQWGGAWPPSKGSRDGSWPPPGGRERPASYLQRDIGVAQRPLPATWGGRAPLPKGWLPN